MASAARRRLSPSAVANEAARLASAAVVIETVSPLPLMPEYDGDKNQKSDEFMRDKIMRAKQECYGATATEDDVKYWETQMITSADGGWSPYWDAKMRGKDATGTDAAVYGEFATYISPEAVKKAVGGTVRAMVTHAMEVTRRAGGQGKGGQVSRGTSSNEEGFLKKQLHDNLKWAGPDGVTDAGPDDTDYSVYEANTPRSWSDGELTTRVADALNRSPHAGDDVDYWCNAIRSESRGADWDYWVHEKMEVPYDE